MGCRTLLWILAMVAVSQSAQAEGFKCTLHHETRVGANGWYDDSTNANPNTDFFLAIDDSGKGTSSFCTRAGCSENTDIIVLDRHDNDTDLVRTVHLLSDSGAILWSLESVGNAKKYRAVAVSISGQLAQSRFGECAKIQSATN